MDAIINTTAGDVHLKRVLKNKVMKMTKPTLNLNTLVPDFTFLNHQGEKVSVVPTSLF
ncbi:MAG: hypothetical protein JKY08_07165 [Flavobacteriaceae bacterium]|nr:hypothetical protein [Flavobacteriaceae bacterium]